MSAEHVHRTENLINSGDRRMPEQKYAGQSENRYRRKRRYGWHVFQLLLVLWIPSFPVVSHWFGTSLWIPAGYWALTLFAAYQLLPQIHVPGSLRQQMAVQGYVWSGAGIYLAVWYGMGVVLKSLAASPYDHSPLGLAGNAVGTFLSLAFREYTRAYGIGTIYRLRKRGGVVASLLRVCFTLLLALTEIPLNRALLVQDRKSLFFFLVQKVFPAIADSAALSSLAYYGGWRAGLIYSAVPELFQRVFPYLPQLPWLVESAVKVAYPVLFVLWLRDRCVTEHGMSRGSGRSTPGDLYRSFAGLAAAVACCWFCVGVFPVYPSVVLTGSMEPGIYPGDVVLIRKITKEAEIYDLKESDVINFSREDYTITHRIVEILLDEAGNISFGTRGDNNPSEDAQAVLPKDVNGIVVGVVPKAGLGVLLLKGGGEAPEGVMTGAEDSGR